MSRQVLAINEAAFRDPRRSLYAGWRGNPAVRGPDRYSTI
jgi:hypothetical protein